MQSPKAPRQYPKPSEGTWTEHYPDLGTAPVSYESSISPESSPSLTHDERLRSPRRPSTGHTGPRIKPAKRSRASLSPSSG